MKEQTRNIILLFLSLIFFIFTSYFLITPVGVFRLYLTGPFNFGLLIGRLLGQISILIIPIIVISSLIYLGFRKEKKFFSIFSLVSFLAASFGLIVTLFKILS